MHELNICLNVLSTLETQADQHHFHRVKTLWLEIGDLAGIELDALRFSFPIAASRTIAENATLKIIGVSGKAWCNDCQNSVIIKTLFDPCPHCGDYNYRITQGKALRIIKVEVE